MGVKTKSTVVIGALVLGIAASAVFYEADRIAVDFQRSSADQSQTCTIKYRICSEEDMDDNFSRLLTRNSRVFTSYVAPGWTTDIRGATWVWEAFFSYDGERDQTIIYQRDLVLPADATGISAELQIAADDFYSASLNGTVIASEQSGYNWILPAARYPAGSAIIPGANDFQITVDSPGIPGKNHLSNPAGLLYCLDYEYQSSCDNCVEGDVDGDYVCGELDNCPNNPNPDQADTDGDGKGDMCDAACVNDTDGDGVCDEEDNCINYVNPKQTDRDKNGVGDMCTVCGRDEGFRAKVYYLEPHGPDAPVPNFPEVMNHDDVFSVSEINVAAGGKPDGFPGVAPYEGAFGVSYNGWIYLSEKRDFDFVQASADDSILYVDGKEVLHVQGPHSVNAGEQGVADLERGLHMIRVNFQANNSGGGIATHEKQFLGDQTIYPIQAAYSGTPGICLTSGGSTTSTPTHTPTSTPTNTPTHTPTHTPTGTPDGTPDSTPTNTPTYTPTSTPASGSGVDLRDYGLHEGDIISSNYFDGDPDVYIVNERGYKRLFLNEIILSFYGHLSFDKIINVSPKTRDVFETSGLFRNCETGDPKVYGVRISGEDTGTLGHVNLTGPQAVAQDPNFFNKIFCINNNEYKWYTNNGTTFGAPFTSLNQIPDYSRY